MQGQIGAKYYLLEFTADFDALHLCELNFLIPRSYCGTDIHFFCANNVMIVFLKTLRGHVVDDPNLPFKEIEGIKVILHPYDHDLTKYQFFHTTLPFENYPKGWCDPGPRFRETLDMIFTTSKHRDVWEMRDMGESISPKKSFIENVKEYKEKRKQDSLWEEMRGSKGCTFTHAVGENIVTVLFCEKCAKKKEDERKKTEANEEDVEDFDDMPQIEEESTSEEMTPLQKNERDLFAIKVLREEGIDEDRIKEFLDKIHKKEDMETCFSSVPPENFRAQWVCKDPEEKKNTP